MKIFYPHQDLVPSKPGRYRGYIVATHQKFTHGYLSCLPSPGHSAPWLVVPFVEDPTQLFLVHDQISLLENLCDVVIVTEYDDQNMVQYDHKVFCARIKLVRQLVNYNTQLIRKTLNRIPKEIVDNLNPSKYFYQALAKAFRRLAIFDPELYAKESMRFLRTIHK